MALIFIPSRSMNRNLLFVIYLLTFIISIVAAVFISRRASFFLRRIQAGSEHNNPFTAFSVIWVESAALIVLFSILYLALFFSGSPATFIIIQSMVHINVRVLNLLLHVSCKRHWQSYYVFKILGYIAASDYLSGGSRKGCNMLTKTT